MPDLRFATEGFNRVRSCWANRMVQFLETPISSWRRQPPMPGMPVAAGRGRGEACTAIPQAKAGPEGSVAARMARVMRSSRSYGTSGRFLFQCRVVNASAGVSSSGRSPPPPQSCLAAPAERAYAPHAAYANELPRLIRAPRPIRGIPVPHANCEDVRRRLTIEATIPL